MVRDETNAYAHDVIYNLDVTDIQNNWSADWGSHIFARDCN